MKSEYVLLGLFMGLFVSGCIFIPSSSTTTTKETTTTTTAESTTTTTTQRTTTTLLECVLSLCDCRCHLKGTTPEETTGVLCGVNCLKEYNVIGCEYKGNTCREVFAPSTTLGTTTKATTALTITTPPTTQAVACYKDSDCGKDKDVGGYYCQGGNVVRDRLEFTCVYAGKPNAYCRDDTTTITKDHCGSNEVCIDGQDNCQKVTTTTATINTTTTTSIQTTTTTIVGVACNTNSDCGTSFNVNICYERDIYKVTKIPMCKNPGTAESYCYIKQVGPSVQGQLVGKIEDCEFGCDPTTVTCRTG